MVIHDFRQAIKAAELFGIGMAVPIADWETISAAHPLQASMGTAEEFAFSGCIYHALNSAQDFAPETDVSLIFDDRDRVTVPMTRIIQHYMRQATKAPNLLGVTFSKMSRLTPLQAADMLAWETYNHAKKWIAAGEVQPGRPHFQDLLTYGRMKGSFMDGEQLRAQFASAIPRTD
jgi:hypothetical protein